VLRFENLSADPSTDWIGRALSEIITEELSAAPNIYAIPAARITTLKRDLGVRPVSVPGISSERTAALAGGADRIAYGDYSVRDGQVRARITIEDPQAQKIVRAVSAAAGDVETVASTLARTVSQSLAVYGTHNPQAIRHWAEAVEAGDAAAVVRDLEEARSADPDFGAPYRVLAQAKASAGDVAGAQALLEQALARGDRVPPIERARIALDLAGYRRDRAARAAAVASLTKLTPMDPAVWQALGSAANERHDYAQAVQAFQKAVEIEPGNVSNWNQLGYAAAWAGDFNTAASALRKYQALRPDDVNALDSLGDVHVIGGRFREAEGFYAEAARKNPGFLNNIELFKAAMARLMTGDVAGADPLAAEYINARTAAHDPGVAYYRAQWAVISGRTAGQAQLVALADGGDPAASTAYAELALLQLMGGDRNASAGRARQAAVAAKNPASAAFAQIVGFLSQPSAPAAEWTARAARLPQGVLRDWMLGCALLLDKQAAAAVEPLKRAYEGSAPTSDDHVEIPLAWALLETGRTGEAAPLLRSWPVPPSNGMGPMMSLWFPRVLDLHKQLAGR
jgi:tetratricopeptide (TPR) repeat protein